MSGPHALLAVQELVSQLCLPVLYLLMLLVNQADLVDLSLELGLCLFELAAGHRELSVCLQIVVALLRGRLLHWLLLHVVPLQWHALIFDCMANRAQLPHLIDQYMLSALAQRLLASSLSSHQLLQIVTWSEGLLLRQCSEMLHLVIDFAHDCLLLLVLLGQVQAIDLG